MKKGPINLIMSSSNVGKSIFKERNSMTTMCPFCGVDPFHYVDIGVGMEAVAVVCCEFGDLYFRGARQPIETPIMLEPDQFREIGDKLFRLRNDARAYAEIVHGETILVPINMNHAKAMIQVAEQYISSCNEDGAE